MWCIKSWFLIKPTTGIEPAPSEYETDILPLDHVGKSVPTEI
jgi:hypothetical protein